jgi:hypothetical protein
MKMSRHTLTQTILARLSFGAVPLDGLYWFDPRDLAGSADRARIAEQARSAHTAPTAQTATMAKDRRLA